ncbi:MAG TPA: TetR/AcrR family transcriptional regulator [Opitutaceae bacterium]|nr:TetR/AcrR family transcriptional regulator [Opitutaceae bacterium]
MSSRKQTEIATREKQILAITQRILEDQGAAGLTMEKVAAQVDFSKGTLYNHFACKEDLILAFITSTIEKYYSVLKKAAVFRGRPRERFVAMSVASKFAKAQDGKHPPKFIVTPDSYQKASPKWREAFLRGYKEIVGLFQGVVRDAIAAGDLPANTDPDIVSFAAWSLGSGSGELHRCGLIFRDLNEEEFGQRHFTMLAHLLDGFGWRPLSSEHDYNATAEKAYREIFPKEFKKSGRRSSTRDSKSKTES